MLSAKEFIFASNILNMKKILSLFALVTVFTISASAQLLYKISGNGLQKPSYIVGTYHLAQSSFVDSIPGMRNAMEVTDQVYGEMDMADMMTPENTKKLQEAMMLPEGTLQSLLTDDELNRLNALMTDLIGFDLSNPLVAQQMGKFTPQALQTQLSMLLLMKRHNGFDMQNQFDSYFQQEAIKNNKPVGGFETVDYQIDVFFKGIPMDRQKKLLMCLVDNREFMEQMADDIINAFYSQNLNAIEDALNEKQNNECDSSPEEENKLIYNRNANWIKQMPEIMASKPTLFVVGAGHLPGDNGVLQLLRNAGYTVEGEK